MDFGVVCRASPGAERSRGEWKTALTLARISSSSEMHPCILIMVLIDVLKLYTHIIWSALRVAWLSDITGSVGA
jgi:hypothetical protein